MIRRRRKLQMPGLNTTSTADISFILLVFFLVISSMDSNKGISKQLPPEDKSKTEQTSEVDRHNVMDIAIGEGGAVTVDGKPLSGEAQLKRSVETFVENSPRRESHVISLTMRPDSKYDDYFHVQNAITSAYSELRDRCAVRLFRRRYADCSVEQQRRVNKLYPQRVMEDIVSGGATAAAGAGGENKGKEAAE